MTSVNIQRHCRARHHSLIEQGLCIAILLTGLLCLSLNQAVVLADDSAAAPAFDMGALASLASNIGSNPQIMGLVSSFLNPNAPGGQKPAFGVSASLGASPDMSEQDPNSIVPGAGPDSMRRAVKPMDAPAQSMPMQQQQGQPQAQSAGAAASATSTGPAAAASAGAPASPLGGLMSMLPGIMSGLGGAGGGGGGGLASLLSGLTAKGPAPPAAAAASAGASATNEQTAQASAATNAAAAAATSAAAASSAPAAVQQQPAPLPAAPGANPAQSVINQVLTAYASGQIPNELIQMGLSGRVPPQIIELALSGQVPPQMIQMIITGQVPMGTINGFLNAMQGGASRPMDGGGSANAASAAAAGQSGAAASSASSSQPGVFSTTRALFEAMFGLGKRNANGKSGGGMSAILKMPGMPNMRSFGQLVGGTITNVASMIPF